MEDMFFTHKQLETYGCVRSGVATDALELNVNKHVINIHNPD